MIRRRKEKFRPILPKSQGAGNAKSEDSKSVDTDNPSEIAGDREKEDLSQGKVIDKIDVEAKDAMKDTESKTNADNDQLASNTNVQEPQPNSYLAASGDDAAAKNNSLVSETSFTPKEPPKSRRRKFTAMPNTKRSSAKPNAGRNMTKTTTDNQVKAPISSSTEASAVVTKSSTNLQSPTAIVKSDSISMQMLSAAQSAAVPPDAETTISMASPELTKIPKTTEIGPAVGSSPTRPPAIMSPPLQRSPPAGSKHIHVHAKRPPNVAQATRVRHDSVRESVVKEKLNKQRAIDKLKILQLREPEKGKKKWPTLDHNLISMSDLIYLNPPKSIGKELGLRAKLREVQEMEERAETPAASPAPVNTEAESAEKEEDEPALVPQLRVNEDGSVVIDEESLVVNSTPKSVEVVNASPAIYESGLSSKVNTLSFRKRPPAKASRWTEKQTRKFFTALGVVGADFDLMSAMFRHRTRDELRRKYNLESRRNLAKIDDALRNQHLSKWTDDMFKPQSSSEDESKPPLSKQRKKKNTKTKTSDKTPSDLTVTMPETISFDASQSHNLLSTILQPCGIVVDSS